MRQRGVENWLLLVQQANSQYVQWERSIWYHNQDLEAYHLGFQQIHDHDPWMHPVGLLATKNKTYRKEKAFKYLHPELKPHTIYTLKNRRSRILKDLQSASGLKTKISGRKLDLRMIEKLWQNMHQKGIRWDPGNSRKSLGVIRRTIVYMRMGLTSSMVFVVLSFQKKWRSPSSPLVR